MTAREMFKKIGYKYDKCRDRNQMIEYRKEDSTSVLFWIKERKFSFSEYCGAKIPNSFILVFSKLIL